MSDLSKHRVEDQPENPYDDAGLVSKIFFWWMNPFIKLGFQKELELKDLYRVPAEDTSKDLGSTLKKQWDKELKLGRSGVGKPNFVRALCNAFGFWYLLSGIWVTVGECVVRPMQAIALGWMIRDVNLYLSLDATLQPELHLATYWQVFYDGLYLIIFSVITLISVHPYVFCTQHTGMKVRIACCQLIYRHSLRLSNAAIGQTTIGQMVNLLTNDVNRFDVALNYIQYLIIAPLQAIIMVTILSTLYLGFYSTVAGSALLLIYVPFQSLMGRWFGKLRESTAARTDERIRLMNEIIPAMRVIKMYTWEDPFAQLVELARQNEVRLIRYTSVLRGVNMALFFVSSKVILFICFMTYVLLGYTLDPEMVFVAITLFNSVRLLMTLFFPYGVAQLAETLISCARLQEFLLLPQQEPSHRVDRGTPDVKVAPGEVKVECQDVSANWTIVNKNFVVAAAADGGGGGGGGNEAGDDSKMIGGAGGAPAGTGLSSTPGAVPKLRPQMASSPPKVVMQPQQRSPTGAERGLGLSGGASSAERLAGRDPSRRGSLLGSTGSLVGGGGGDGGGGGGGSRGSSRTSVFASMTNVHLKAADSKSQLLGAVTGAGHAGQQTAIVALRNITYEVKGGELMMIVGRVGSGKSSVLMSILGELPLASGRMKTRGTVSYSAQEAWIFAGTVRENVLFGRPMNEPRYKRVLEVCSLGRDIHLFPQGDETIVGERGVSLSGGQRARINLARAIYYEADIYLLDDPLSAVDTVVAKHIFTECICGFLKEKAVILATHQTQFVRTDTKVLFLQDGRQISCKSFADNLDLQRFIGSTWEKSDSESAMSSAKHTRRVAGRLVPIDQQPRPPSRGSLGEGGAGAALELAPPLREVAPDGTTDSLESGGSSSSSSSSASSSEAHERPATTPAEGDEANEAAKITGEAPIKQQAETTKFDSAGCSIYLHYVRATQACWLVGVIAVTNLGTQALFNGSDFWLSYWTDTEQRKAANGGSSDYPPVTLTDTLSLRQNALVYTGLIVSLFVLTLARTTCFFVACMRSSINLHNRLFSSLLRAPIKFFDYNPIGILLNRVSRDMGIVDDLLPPTAFDTIEIFINVVGILITVAVVYPLNVVPAIILCTIVFVIRLLYIRTVRSIKSIEGVTRSPVFSHLAASLNGLATIRAFRVEPEFEVKFDQYQDIHSSAWFLFVAASRWLGISLDWICLAYIGVITIVMTLTVGSTTGSQIGLAISSALFLSGSFQWGVRQSTEMESQMTSVSRIKEYSELPEEPPRESPPGNKPPPEWPAWGRIEFDQVNLRYFENEEPVLKGLTFAIRAGEKVGIVGRTGAGKSSIIAVLFRLTEPEGCIKIDGIDTKSIGLHDLRKKLSIIPQEPILFNGPVRRNLDPFNEYGDTDLWRALEQVKLAEVVRNLPGALESELAEGGSNFSVGERQLICLARAVLRQNRIIILDEATANVDPDTDKFIQRTISESFVNCTRLTIAHRLNTIMDSDKVLVMDAGRVREFDEPHLLLQNENGFFSNMVRNTGKNATRLKKIARNYHAKRHNLRQQTAPDSTTPAQQAGGPRP